MADTESTEAPKTPLCCTGNPWTQTTCSGLSPEAKQQTQAGTESATSPDKSHAGPLLL